MVLSFLLVILGLAILIYAADLLVKGSASLSKKAGISSLVIGLTVVSFGTSAPELIVNIFSAIQGTTGISLGNIVGSNIANILLILGVGSLITTLKVQKSTTWKEIPFALLAAILLLTISNDIILDNHATNMISRSEGIALMGFFIIFMYYTFSIARNQSADDQEDIPLYSISKSILLTILGMIGLFLGGKVLIDNAVDLATQLGVSQVLIGVTIVAIGTSLPELVTTVVAAMKKQTDIAVGNVVGSCIFNIFWILGLTSLIKPIPIEDAINYDILVSLLATILLFIAVFVNKKHAIAKLEGTTFLLIYFVYMGSIIIRG